MRNARSAVFRAAVASFPISPFVEKIKGVNEVTFLLRETSTLDWAFRKLYSGRSFFLGMSQPTALAVRWERLNEGLCITVKPIGEQSNNTIKPT